MNNINITHELCAEDRARIDRLTAALEAFNVPVVDIDIQKKLAETLAKTSDPVEAPKNATEATKVETLPTDHPAEEEQPWGEPVAKEEAKPTVTLEQIQQKVVQLAAANGGAKKAKVREIINAYGAKVSDLKDRPDKWGEVWDKLAALESEG